MKLHEKFILILSCFTSFVLFTSCDNDANANSKKKENIKKYSVLTILPRKITLFVEYPATIQGQQNVEIRARVDGFIDRINIDEGSLVHKGQVLFVLDDRQYKQNISSAEANVKVAEAEISVARLQVEKIKKLVDKNIVSPYELESAELTLNSKEALLAQAKANLQNSRINLSYTQITSPSNGIVSSIPYKIGSLVGPATPMPLTTVSNIGNIYAYFSMNEKDFLNLSRENSNNSIKKSLKKMPKILLLLADKTVYPYPGTIETVNGLIDPQTGSVNFRAVFSNPAGSIRSGSSAIIRIPTNLDSALVVPQNATYELQDKRFVYIVNAKGKVTNTEITVRPLNNGKFYVVTSGLKAGDQIVTEGVGSLKDGTRIIPVLTNQENVFKNLN